jgi:hypothetical protein
MCGGVVCDLKKLYIYQSAFDIQPDFLGLFDL